MPATIAIERLTPGETGLAADRLAKYRLALARGDALDPIHIVMLGAQIVVRDGNTRVRAVLDHHAACGTSPPEIVFVDSTIPLVGESLRGLKKIAAFYGPGAAAFLRLPVAARPSDYEPMQAAEARKVFAAMSHID